MGPGKLLPWSLPIRYHEEEPNVGDLFAYFKSQKVADMARTPKVEGDDVTTDTKDGASCSAIFSCREEECAMRILTLRNRTSFDMKHLS